MKTMLFMLLISLSGLAKVNKLADRQVDCTSFNSFPVYLKIENSYFKSEYLTFGLNLDQKTCHFHQDNFDNVIYWKKKTESSCSTVAGFIRKHSKPENSNFTYVNKNEVELRMKTMVKLNEKFPNTNIDQTLTIESKRTDTGHCQLNSFIKHQGQKKLVKEIFIKLGVEWNPLPSATVTDGNVRVKESSGIQKVIFFK